MGYIVVSLVVNANPKTITMTKEAMSELAVKLQKGKTTIHFDEEKFEIEGFMVLSKGWQHATMI